MPVGVHICMSVCLSSCLLFVGLPACVSVCMFARIRSTHPRHDAPHRCWRCAIKQPLPTKTGRSSRCILPHFQLTSAVCVSPFLSRTLLHYFYPLSPLFLPVFPPPPLRPDVPPFPTKTWLKREQEKQPIYAKREL